MDTKNAKLLVVGAGAIGGITAGYLAKAGRNVGVVDKSQSIVDRIRSEGLHVFGAGGEFRVSLPAYAGIEEVPEKIDIIFLATKATTLPGVAEALKPVLHEGSRVVSLQNGICEELIARVVGEDSTVGCVVGWGATMHAPGELEMTSKGDFIIGRLDGRIDAALPTVQEILASVRPTVISTNIMGHLYAKLVINSCITTLGAVSGLYLGKMLTSRRVRVVFIGIIREAMAVAGAMGLRVEPLARFDFAFFLKGPGFLGNLKRHALIRLLGFKYRKLKSSSLQSLERGEKTEIDFFNGYIGRKGRELSIPTPLNDRLVAIVKEIEAGRRAIGLANFEEPLFLEV
jgi:2-dehydropantoate 2-reductase